MIRLSMPAEPYWLTLEGFDIRLQVRPPTTALVAAATSRAARKMRELRQRIDEVRAAGGAVTGLPDIADDDAAGGLAELALIQALGQFAVIAWEGVLAPDGDGPAPVSEASVGDLLAIWPVGPRFRDAYLEPLAGVEAEKNASRPAAAGTSAAGRTIAGVAPSKGSAARKGRRGRTASAAPTTSTSR